MPPSAPREIPVEVVRRLAITRQRLAGPRPRPTRDGIVETVRDLGYLQLDPINVVARSHQLVLWSRLGPYDLGDLEALLSIDRRLFEYWAYRAAIVPTEDYPIHAWLMRRYPRPIHAQGRRTVEWLAANQALRRHVLAQLRRRGPMRLRDFEDRAVTSWTSSGWTDERNVDRMLDILWTQGRVFPVERAGGTRMWDLAERVLPAWTPRERLSDRELTRRTAQRSLRAMGVATARQITNNFTVNRYPRLPEVVEELERQKVIERVTVTRAGTALTGTWFLHAADMSLADALARGEGWEPCSTLLSPFDNLIIDRARAEALWGFFYRMEIYVPKDKRRFGYYSLPILDGDRLIGQVEPVLDRRRGVLVVNSLHAEAGAPMDPATARTIRASIEDLAVFTGARDVEVPAAIPRGWGAVRRG
jgi:uncharacterized protein